MSVLIIAEAGVNHNGSIEIAKKMVDAAEDAGADYIKFQTYKTDNIVLKTAKKADYQKQYCQDETQYEMLKKLELTYNQFYELKDYCKEKPIEFLSTAFDFDSIDFLSQLGMQRWKVPSGEITNLPYMLKIAKDNKPIILSTGMSTMDDIRAAVSVLKSNGSVDITLLHCTTEYPAPFEDVNLKAMERIESEFGLDVGYSDHTAGIEVAIAAVALGAKVIEKHFTLDRTMEGPDHKASIEPEELKSMVSAIRHIEVAIGDGEKKIAESERKNIEIARKSIVAKHKIKTGDLYSEENLTVKRPGRGITPMRWFEVIGQIANRDYEEDELIEL